VHVGPMTVLKGLAMLPDKGTLTRSKAPIQDEFISAEHQKQSLLNCSCRNVFHHAANVSIDRHSQTDGRWSAVSRVTDGLKVLGYRCEAWRT
jgi:hypothetical protein